MQPFAALSFSVALFPFLFATAAPAAPATQATTASVAAVAPNENLVTDGIPPIPASVAEEAQRYTEFRSAGFVSWHPVERRMLIRTRFADTVQIHLVRQPMGARTQLTFFPDSVVNAAFPPTAGKDGGDFIVFSKDKGGNEFAQLYRYDLGTGDITMLTDGRSRNSPPVFTRAGKRFVYTSTRRNRRDPDFYVTDPADPNAEKMLMQADAPGWEPIDWSPDESRLVAEQYVSANESHLFLVDAATGQRTRLSPETANKEKVRWSGGQFSPDGRRVYCTTDQGSEFQRLATIDVETKQVNILTPDLKWDVEDFDLSWDGKVLAYVSNEDGMAVLHLMETATGKPLPTPKLPAGQIAGLSWHRNDKDLAFTLTSARAPGDVYSLDVTSSQVTRWTESETAGLNTAGFPEPQLVRWKSFDGKEISGFLYMPNPSKTRRPVIINIHGGPESQYRPGFMGAYNYYVTRLGCAAIFPNVRGSAGYGKTFLTLDDGRRREDSVKDIGALLDWIKSQPELDADRVMVTGGSYGGYMSLAVSTHYADRLRCSVDVVGISNFVSFLEHTEAYRQDLRRVEYGDERDPEMRKFLEAISPLNHADRITKPMFVVQGANDPRVPHTEAEQIVAALKKQGTPVWYLMAKDEGHGFARKPNQQFQFYATIEFIRRYLVGPKK
jgi:dipeptidyl aminopeptidase/acylaminoacyl peptidase